MTIFIRQYRFYAFVFLTIIIGLSSCQTYTPSQAGVQKQAEIYLVRHAEKTKAARDPDLTPEGRVRADQLAKVLADTKITRIHSSNYKRTLQTAAPLAEALGLEVQLYDPRDLPAMAARLKAAGGSHLVVGHSNTTPQLTELLGGEPHTPIVEATEYDRLYIVNLAEDGSVSSTLLRFGN